MVSIDWGTKRICQQCSTKFFDLRRSPILCPKCGHTYELQLSHRGRKSKAAIVSDKDDQLPELEDVPLDEDVELADDTLLEEDDDIDEDELDVDVEPEDEEDR